MTPSSSPHPATAATQEVTHNARADLLVLHDIAPWISRLHHSQHDTQAISATRAEPQGEKMFRTLNAQNALGLAQDLFAMVADRFGPAGYHLTAFTAPHDLPGRLARSFADAVSAGDFGVRGSPRDCAIFFKEACEAWGKRGQLAAPLTEHEALHLTGTLAAVAKIARLCARATTLTSPNLQRDEEPWGSVVARNDPSRIVHVVREGGSIKMSSAEYDRAYPAQHRHETEPYGFTASGAMIAVRVICKLQLVLAAAAAEAGSRLLAHGLGSRCPSLDHAKSFAAVTPLSEILSPPTLPKLE